MMTTKDDIKKALIKGYRFNKSPARVAKIINRRFSGFDIPVLVGDLERLLEPYAIKPIAKEITVTDPPPVMNIEYKSYNFLNEEHGLYVSRRFNYINDDLTVYHDWQQLPYSCRNQGIGRKLMAAFLEQYENMNVKRIDLFAALSDGGAVWAKFGFKATKKIEMEQILRSAETALIEKPKILQALRDTFHNYYTSEPYGTAFPIQNWVTLPGMEAIMKMSTSHWHGRLDLTNTKDLRNFKLYVGQKE